MLNLDYVGKCKEQTGKDFRHSLNKPLPSHTSKVVKLRSVPAFSIQSLQKNTKVIKPRLHAHVTQKLPPTKFRKLYDIGKMPFYVSYDKAGFKCLAVKEGVYLDCQYFLPILFEALIEIDYPYCYIVTNALQHIMQNHKEQILPAVPYIIMPIKKAMSSKIPSAVTQCLKLIQFMVKNCEGVGLALTPYYKHLLPNLNIFLQKDRYLMYVRNREDVIGNLIEDTLQILECYGGPDAFINIKYMIPTYESYFYNC